MIKHIIVVCQPGIAHFLSGQMHIQGDGIELYLGDLSVLCCKACHHAAPNVLLNTVALSATLAPVVHQLLNCGVGGQALVGIGICRLHGNRLRLEYEVAQTVEDGLALVHLNALQLVRPVAQNRICSCINTLIRKAFQKSRGQKVVIVIKGVEMNTDQHIVCLFPGLTDIFEHPLHIPGIGSGGHSVFIA